MKQTPLIINKFRCETNCTTKN